MYAKGLFLVLFFSFSNVNANYFNNYIPIKTLGEVPAEFLEDPVKHAKKMAALEKELNRKQAREFYESTYTAVSKKFKSGNIYYNDPLTGLVREIASKLNYPSPEIKNSIKIYVSRSVYPNARVFPDGSIFLNAGLIALLENEDQLAYIIAHEISHFELKHALKRYKHFDKLEDRDSDGQRRLFRWLRHTRENEFEADARAIHYLVNSPYDINAGIRALKLLHKLETGFEENEFDLYSYFNNEHFTIDTGWLSKNSIEIRTNEIKSAVSKSFFSDEMEDLGRTHPYLDKRILAVNTILQSIQKENRNIQNLKNITSTYKPFREMSLFEIVENSFFNANYSYSIYLSIKLLKEYPDNIFLKINILRCLYWLSHYREKNAQDRILTNTFHVNTQNYYNINTLLSHLGINDFKQICYGYAKQNENYLNNSEQFLIYLAKITKSYIGFQAALFIFNQYLEKFPDGKFISFVKSNTQ